MALALLNNPTFKLPHLTRLHVIFWPTTSKDFVDLLKVFIEDVSSHFSTLEELEVEVTRTGIPELDEFESLRGLRVIRTELKKSAFSNLRRFALTMHATVDPRTLELEGFSVADLVARYDPIAMTREEDELEQSFSGLGAAMPVEEHLIKHTEAIVGHRLRDYVTLNVDGEPPFVQDVAFHIEIHDN